MSQYNPSFFPLFIQRSSNDTSNFEDDITSASISLSPADSEIMAEIDPDLFDGFSYTNEAMHLSD